MSSVELGSKESSSPEVVAAFGANAVVLQRVILKVAADTYGDPITLTLEILGTDGDSSRVRRRRAFRGRARGSGQSGVGAAALARSVQRPVRDRDDRLRRRQADWRQPAEAHAQRPDAACVPGGIRRRDPSPPAGARVRGDCFPDSWGAKFGVTTFELTIPKSAAGDLLGIFLPSAGVVLRGKLLFRLDAGGFHFDGGVGLSTSGRMSSGCPASPIHSLSTSVAISGSDFSVSATGTIVVFARAADGHDRGVRDQAAAAADHRRQRQSRHHRPADAGLRVADRNRRRDRRECRQGRRLPPGHGHADRRRARARPRRWARSSCLFRRSESSKQINGEMSFVVIMSVEFTPAIEIFLASHSTQSAASSGSTARSTRRRCGASSKPATPTTC